MNAATPPELPLVGAALRAHELPQHRDWLLDGMRDLEIQDPAWPDFHDQDWQPMAAEIRAQLVGYTGRMGVHAPFISLSLAAADRLVREAVQTRLRQTLDFCAAIGATHMVIHSPTNFLGTPYLPSQPDFGQQMMFDTTRQTLAPVIAQAEQTKCTLVIENIFDKLPGLWVALAREMHSDYVRCSLDVGHAFVNHHLGAPAPDSWVREAGDMLAHVHVQDTDGFADRHWVPGEGIVAWPSIFRAIAALNARPRLILELIDHTLVREGAAYLAGRGLVR